MLVEAVVKPEDEVEEVEDVVPEVEPDDELDTQKKSFEQIFGLLLQQPNTQQLGPHCVKLQLPFEVVLLVVDVELPPELEDVDDIVELPLLELDELLLELLDDELELLDDEELELDDSDPLELLLDDVEDVELVLPLELLDELELDEDELLDELLDDELDASDPLELLDEVEDVVVFPVEPLELDDELELLELLDELGHELSGNPFTSVV